MSVPPSDRFSSHRDRAIGTESSVKGSTPHFPIRTGSGQSVNGTSGQRQGAPFAGRFLRPRLHELVDADPRVRARTSKIRPSHEDGAAAARESAGWAEWSKGDWQLERLRALAVTHSATRSAARSRIVAPPRHARGSEGARGEGGVGNGTLPLEAGSPSRSSSRIRGLPGQASLGRWAPARVRRG